LDFEQEKQAFSSRRRLVEANMRSEVHRVAAAASNVDDRFRQMLASKDAGSSNLQTYVWDAVRRVANALAVDLDARVDEPLSVRDLADAISAQAGDLEKERRSAAALSVQNLALKAHVKRLVEKLSSIDSNLSALPKFDMQ
jgi:hypothetical protein